MRRGVRARALRGARYGGRRARRTRPAASSSRRLRAEACARPGDNGDLVVETERREGINRQARNLPTIRAARTRRCETHLRGSRNSISGRSRSSFGSCGSRSASLLPSMPASTPIGHSRRGEPQEHVADLADRARRALRSRHVDHDDGLVRVEEAPDRAHRRRRWLAVRRTRLRRDASRLRIPAARCNASATARMGTAHAGAAAGPPPPPPGSAAPPPTWGTPPPAAPPTWGTEPPRRARGSTAVMAVGSVFLIFVLVGLLGVVLAIIQIVQSSSYPDWAYQQVGTSKFVWQILPIIWIFVCSIAAVVQYLMWISKRDEVARGRAVHRRPAATATRRPDIRHRDHRPDIRRRGRRRTAPGGAAVASSACRTTCARSPFTCPRRCSTTCATGSRARAGPTRSRAAVGATAPTSRTSRSCASTGSTKFDWRAQEDRFNRWPHFLTDDRRPADPLHPRALRQPRRAAVDHHARLARIGRRVPRRHRAAARRLPRRRAVASRLRLVGSDDRAGLGRGSASRKRGRR